MKKRLLLLFCALFSLVAFSQKFPVTKKTTTTISKHQISFQDDYTWLEDMKSDAVLNWANAENEVTDLHLEEIQKDYSIAGKIKEYDVLSSNGLPQKKGHYFYGLYRKDKKIPASLYYRKTLNDIPIEIANPFKIYRDENVFITDYYPSKNSVLLAYKTSISGSDRQEIRFVDIPKNKDLSDVITDVKFSNVAWNLDSGVFYKRNSNHDFFAKDSTYQLFYHKIGDLQQDDKLIFDTTKTESNFSFTVIKSKLFIIEQNKEETIKNYYYANLNADPIVLENYLPNDSSGMEFLNFINGRVYFSSKNSDWGEIRSFDITNRADETVIVPQIYTHLLVDSYFYEDYIVCKYKTLGNNYLIVYDKNGVFIRKFDVPYAMDFIVKFLDNQTKELFVSFYSYTIPFLNYKLNIETGRTNPYYNDYIVQKPTLFPFDHFETKTITYKSRDNQDVPMTIVYKKGLVLDGNNPTLLKGYGGFGTISGPYYDTGLLYFLEKGGVFAYAEIRGGGEKGLKWHLKGAGLNKMNTFNDFIDAAEFLIHEKYTCSNRLAITGGSQGGLLVGVAMTKRPDLFKVVISQMGAFDMAKFGKYTIGKFHFDEYGNPENEEEYKALLAYSPYHNIKEDVNYPTCLIITSDHDDRVPPVHSYKFAAKLQNRDAQKNPIYLKTLSNSGHYGKVSNYKNHLEEKADFYNFLLYHLNK
jgi:prolyl oligopeptidase